MLVRGRVLVGLLSGVEGFDLSLVRVVQSQMSRSLRGFQRTPAVGIFGSYVCACNDGMLRPLLTLVLLHLMKEHHALLELQIPHYSAMPSAVRCRRHLALQWARWDVAAKPLCPLGLQDPREEVLAPLADQ
eukprot:5273996-Pyramimonas_sp.AAC.1